MDPRGNIRAAFSPVNSRLGNQENVYLNGRSQCKSLPSRHTLYKQYMIKQQFNIYKLARMEEGRSAFKILTDKPTGKRI